MGRFAIKRGMSDFASEVGVFCFLQQWTCARFSVNRNHPHVLIYQYNQMSNDLTKENKELKHQIEDLKEGILKQNVVSIRFVLTFIDEVRLLQRQGKGLETRGKVCNDCSSWSIWRLGQENDVSGSILSLLQRFAS
jgi:hypothetical protein